MEKEISSGTMLGIVLIALAAVIGLGFGVFSIAKGVANEGVVNVQDNLGTVSESQFTDYDQKLVTGTQVLAAYKAFEGKPVAIFINTQAMIKGVKASMGHDLYIQGIQSGTGTSLTAPVSNVRYINYNAILAADGGGAAPGKIAGAAGAVANTDGVTNVLSLYNGVVKTTQGFALNTAGKIIVDSTITGMTKAGNCEYISSSAKFEANLVKDDSSTIVGVVFTQLAK